MDKKIRVEFYRMSLSGLLLIDDVGTIIIKQLLHFHLSYPDGTLAVMVFIHGGGFTVGSANTNVYEATSLTMNTQAVIVTINYRLGALGFLNTGSGGVNGNMGLMDQVSV